MRALRLPRRRPRARAAHAVAVTDEPLRPAAAAAQGPERELASRQNGGLHISLLWDPRDDLVAVAVADRCSDHAFRFAVDAARALDAFHHPFAYAP